MFVGLGLGLPGALCLGQQIETPAGIVEFVGLHQWTIQMIQDSMKVHAPGQPLGHCAAVLRALGFPSAQSLYMTSPEGRSSTLVILVEPKDSSRVRYRRLPTRARAAIKAWGPAYGILRNDVAAYQSGAQDFGIHATGDSALEHLILHSSPKDSAQIRYFWRFLERSRNAQSANLAERTLLEDANVENRMVAASVLGAQRGRVGAWYALVKRPARSRRTRRRRCGDGTHLFACGSAVSRRLATCTHRCPSSTRRNQCARTEDDIIGSHQDED